eukprot:COSAG01_NODE_90_length_27307_cov_734.166458_25_plen_518_part_00
MGATARALRTLAVGSVVLLVTSGMLAFVGETNPLSQVFYVVESRAAFHQAGSNARAPHVTVPVPAAAVNRTPATSALSFAAAMLALAPSERADLVAAAKAARRHGDMRVDLAASGWGFSNRSERVDIEKTTDFSRRMLEMGGVTVVRRPKLFHSVVHSAAARTTRNPTLHDESILQSLRDNNREAYQRYARQIAAGEPAWADMELEHYAPGSAEPIPGIAVMQHAFVDEEGNVCDAKHCIGIRSCEMKVAKPREIAGKPHDQLYVVAQNQGHGFWHFFGEDFVRISVGIDLLLEDKSIKVHVVRKNAFTKDYMRLVGIDESRLIEGVATARVLFYPEPSACGSPSRYIARQTRHMLRTALLLPPSSGAPAAAARPRILVVKRSGSRKVLNHDALVVALSRVAGDTADVEVFDDKFIPGARKTLELFGTSAIIVGPHGAGLANIAVAPPGTTVVEFIVSDYMVNICYMVLATKLALDYHAVTDSNSSHTSPMTVDVEKVAGIVSRSILGGSGPPSTHK